MVTAMNSNKTIRRYWLFNARYFLPMFLFYAALAAALSLLRMPDTLYLVMLFACMAGICCSATSLFYPMGSYKAKTCLLSLPVSRETIWKNYFTGVTVLEIAMVLVDGLLVFLVKKDAEFFLLILIAALGSHALLSRVPHTAMAFIIAILPSLLVIVPRMVCPGVFGGPVGWITALVLIPVDACAWYREKYFFVNVEGACRPERNSLC